MGVPAMRQYPFLLFASLIAFSCVIPSFRRFRYLVRTRFHFFQHTIRMRLCIHFRCLAAVSSCPPACSIKSRSKVFGRLSALLPQLNEHMAIYKRAVFDIREEYTIEYVRYILDTFLNAVGMKKGDFVHGKGKRKSFAQRLWEAIHDTPLIKFNGEFHFWNSPFYLGCFLTATLSWSG